MVADSSKGLIETIKEKIMAVFDKDLVGDEFEESEHPRAKNGQFTTKAGGVSGSKENDSWTDLYKYLDNVPMSEKETWGRESGKYFFEKKGKEGGFSQSAIKTAFEKWNDGFKDAEESNGPEGFEYVDKLEDYLADTKNGTVRLSYSDMHNGYYVHFEDKEGRVEGEQNFKNDFKKAKEYAENLLKRYKKEESSEKEKSSKEKEYAEWWNGLSDSDKKDAILAVAEKDPKVKELLGEKLYKNIVGDAKLDDSEKEKVGVVMKEFKEGKLKSGSGEKVTDPKQAMAIALSESEKVAEDKEIPEKAGKPEKAGEENALQQGEKKMAEEVKEEVKTEKKVETTPAEEKPVEDACSKDAEIKEEKKSEEKGVEDKDEKDLNGKEKKAFAEGVDFGEKKEKEEPKKLDSEHESEGTKKADEEKKEEKKDMAKDSALVMDADALRAEGRAEAMADYKAREVARKSVRSIVGDVDVFAFDSAEEIYKFACKEAGMNLDEIASYKDAFIGLQAGKAKLAMDASPVSGSNEECLKDIRLG